jgi:hypothetical protein
VLVAKVFPRQATVTTAESVVGRSALDVIGTSERPETSSSS